MIKRLAALAFLIVLVFAQGMRADIVSNRTSGQTAEDSLPPILVTPTDSLDNPVVVDSANDSVYVIIKRGKDSVFAERILLDATTNVQLTWSTGSDGAQDWFYCRQISDIDGVGRKGTYTVTTRSVDKTTNLRKTRRDQFQLIDSALSNIANRIARQIANSGTVSTLAAADNIGINWANVSNPTSAVTMSFTAIGTVENLGSGAIQAADFAAGAIDATALGGTAATEIADSAWRSGISKYRVGGNYTTAAWKDSVIAAAFASAGGAAGYRTKVIVDLDSAAGTLSDAQIDQIGVDALAISGNTTAADNAKAFFDGTGYAGTGNTIPTVTTVTNSIGTSLSASEVDADVSTEIWASTGGDSVLQALDYTNNTHEVVRQVVSTVAAVTDVTNSLGTSISASEVDADVSNEIWASTGGDSVLQAIDYTNNTHEVVRQVVSTVATVTDVTNSIGTTLGAAEIEMAAADKIGFAAMNMGDDSASWFSGADTSAMRHLQLLDKAITGVAGGGSGNDSLQIRRWVWDSTSGKYSTPGAIFYKRVIDTILETLSECGAGTGLLSDTVYAVDTSGTDTAIPNVLIQAKNASGTLLGQGITTGNGYTVLNLPQSVSVTFTGFLPGYTWPSRTLTMEAGLTDTDSLFGYDLTVSVASPPSSQMTTVYGNAAIGTDTLKNGLVHVTLVGAKGFYTSTGAVVPVHTKVFRANASGDWQGTVYGTDSLTAFGSGTATYTIRYEHPLLTSSGVVIEFSGLRVSANGATTSLKSILAQ